MSELLDVHLVSILTYTSVLLLVFMVWRLFKKPAPPSKLDEAALRCCGTCEHFDLAEGQAILRRFPTFIEATRMVSLNRQTTKYDENGNVLEAGAVPERATLEQFGACLKLSELRWNEDPGCELYQLRTKRRVNV